MAKNIVHGNRNFGYAEILLAGSTYSFGTPKMLPGMVSFDMEVNQDTSIVYADDVAYYPAKGAKVRNAKANFKEISSDYATYLGFKKNENGSISDTGTFKPHCIFFESTIENIETGESTKRLHYLYNVKAGEPNLSTATDEEAITTEVVEVAYNALESSFVLDDDDKNVQYTYFDRTAATADVYDTFKTVVLMPTTDMTPPAGGGE